MARKVRVVLACDLHDEHDVEAVETTLFGLDGAAYEIELCEDHSRQLHETVDPFAAAGRRIGTRPRRARVTRPLATRSRRPTPAPAEPPAVPSRTGGGGAQAAMRAWARTHGYTVSDRGRLPAEVVTAYKAAQ